MEDWLGWFARKPGNLRCHLWNLPCDSFQLARMWLDQSGPFEEKADSFEQGLWYTVWCEHYNTITVLMYTTAISELQAQGHCAEILIFWETQKIQLQSSGGREKSDWPVVSVSDGTLSNHFPIFWSGPLILNIFCGLFPRWMCEICLSVTWNIPSSMSDNRPRTLWVDIVLYRHIIECVANAPRYNINMPKTVYATI